MQRIIAFWNKGLVGKVTIVLVGLVVVCCVLGALVGRGGSQPTRAGATPAPAVIAGDVVTAAPEPTSAPDATAGPTNTPKPTSTPAPTATPSPIPATATPIPPVVLEGSGQTVTDPFTPPSTINRVFLTHQGQRNFIVRVFKADGSEEGMANEIGNYEGIRPLIGAAGEYYFEIDADGPWTIHIEAMTQELDASDGLEGSGDYVSGVFTPESDGPTPYNVAHNGERNFIAHLYCAGGEDSVQNEIGAVSGSTVVRFAEGPCFWDVQADGAWSLMPK
jgi:hypothetical protein